MYYNSSLYAKSIRRFIPLCNWRAGPCHLPAGSYGHENLKHTPPRRLKALFCRTFASIIWQPLRLRRRLMCRHPVHLCNRRQL